MRSQGNSSAAAPQTPFYQDYLLLADDALPEPSGLKARYQQLDQAPDGADRRLLLSKLVCQQIRVLEKQLAEGVERDVCRASLASLVEMQKQQFAQAQAAQDNWQPYDTAFGTDAWLAAFACALLQQDDAYAEALIAFVAQEQALSALPKRTAVLIRSLKAAFGQLTSRADERISDLVTPYLEAVKADDEFSLDYPAQIWQPLLQVILHSEADEPAFNQAVIAAMMQHQHFFRRCAGHSEFKPALLLSALAALVYRSKGYALTFENPSLMQALIIKAYDDSLIYQEHHASITITGYIGQETELTLPDTINGKPVTHLAEQAFTEKQLTKVVLPSKLRSLGRQVFCHNQLGAVTLPETLNYVGEDAFHDNGLQQLMIPQAVAFIGDGAFSRNALETLDIKAPLTKIPDYCFSRNRLTQLQLPDSVTEIGSSAFAYNAFEELVIPPQIESIGSQGFENLPSIRKVIMPECFMDRIENIFYQSDMAEAVFEAHG